MSRWFAAPLRWALDPLPSRRLSAVDECGPRIDRAPLERLVTFGTLFDPSFTLSGDIFRQARQAAQRAWTSRPTNQGRIQPRAAI